MKRKLLTIFLAGIMLYGINNEKISKMTIENPVQTQKIGMEDYRNEKSGDKEMISELSKTVRPQDDFYKFVNEMWENRTEIPSTKPAWGAFTELNEENQKFLKDMIAELKKKKNNITPDEKKVLILYNTYYDVKKRDKEGLKPLQEDLKKINVIKNVDDFEKFTIEITKKGRSTLYGWGIGSDLNDSFNNAVYMGAAGLGLSKDYYQKETKENEEIIKEYTRYVKDMLDFLGESNSGDKARNIVEFEKKIANTFLTNEESHDVKKYNNPRTVKQLSGIVKNVNLENYLKESGVNTDKVIISQIKYYENLDKFINEDNINIIKDYMKFHLISGSAGILTDSLGKRKFEFYGKYLNGQKEREVLEKRALYFVDGTLGEIISKIYVERKFSPEAKKDTQEMVDYIVKAFRNRVQDLTWMSSETKKKAIEKLNKFTVKIGYPDKWEDFSRLEINSKDTLYEQMGNIDKWLYTKELEKVGKPVDKKEWFMNAHEVNAYYSPTKNEIVFPAGILQFPFYDLNKSGAGSNFGGIGAVIGHELTHGFDVSGANFDGDGNVKDWWTKEDREKFDHITKKLEEEFSGYSVSENVSINGKFTLTENIADLGGINIAYDALQLYLKDHPEKDIKVGGYTQDELFFMNNARIWRQKATKEFLNNMVKSDSHSPNYFRVNGTFKNSDAFHKVFKTEKKDKLYKYPKDRIRIW